MTAPSKETRKLARRLLALEASSADFSTSQGGGAARVYQKLQVRFAKVAGEEGFRTLVSRALDLARSEAPILAGVGLRPDYSFEGLEQARREGLAEAEEIIVAHLLELLITFIGSALTMGFVHGVWTAAALGTDSRSKEDR